MKSNLKLLSAICAIAAALVTLSACSHEDAPPPPPPAPAPAPAPMPGS